jgi:hypothetical protein
VAEEAEVHLLPHVESWCREDPRLGLTDAHTDEMGAYVLNLEWNGAPGTVGNARAAV